MGAPDLRLVDSGGRPLRHRLYDGASVGRRTSHWRTDSSGPNREIYRDLATLRNRHRDLARNNPWARRAIAALVNNTIGSGIVAQWRSKRRQARWSEWAGTVACDADGRSDFCGLQATVMRAVVESGEVLIRRRLRRTDGAAALPLELQILESDYLDLTRNEPLATGGQIVQGVEFDASGRRVAYWLFTEHPGDPTTGLGSALSQRYDAADILHIYRLDRPGQIRGVPWGTGALMRLRMLDDYQDAQLERQRLAACYMAFRRIPDPLLAGDQPDTEYTLSDKLEPGAIEDLPPGWDMSFASPPQPENDGEWVRGILRAVAADYLLPYEVLTGDLSQVNFSSARMGFQEFGRSIDAWRWGMLAPQFLSQIARWFLDAELLAGVGGNPETPIWTAPSRQIVDPAREIPALRDAVRAGLLSLPQAIRAQGFDPLVLAHEHAAYLAELDRLGIATDSDARHGTSGPAPSAAPGDAAGVDPAAAQDAPLP